MRKLSNEERALAIEEARKLADAYENGDDYPEDYMPDSRRLVIERLALLVLERNEVAP